MKRLVDATKWVSNHQAITGFATLAGTIIGLIAALRSQDALIRVSGLIFMIFAGLILLYVCLPYIVSIGRWLTWKFALGLAIGIVAAAFLYPFVASVVEHIMSQPGQIEVTHTDPQSGSKLERPSGSIDVYFSKPLTKSERSRVYITIEPEYPIKWFWVIDYSNEIHQLCIEPTKYFPNERVPRFEYAKEYKVEITGRPITEKVTIVFYTPQKEGVNSSSS